MIVGYYPHSYSLHFLDDNDASVMMMNNVSEVDTINLELISDACSAIFLQNTFY